jgi:putative inorganic carbon (HCO3(-)) transporter
VNKTISKQKAKAASRIAQIIERIFLIRKLNNWVGILLFCSVAVVMAYLLSTRTVLGIAVFVAIVGLALVIACLLNTETGFYINLFYTFFVYHFSRLAFSDGLPVSVIIDGLLVLILFSLFIKGISLKKSINEFTKSTIIIFIILNFLYGALELFNPEGHSFDAWIQAIRRSIETFIFLFIAFHILHDKQSIKRYIKILFIICTIVGIYGCIQQWHGLFNFERNWVMADEVRFGLDWINGDFRKFSTFNDPTAFGNMMSASSVFFTILALGLKDQRTKWILLSGVVVMLLGMAYSGTRTANVMLLAGFGMFVLLSFNKKSTQLFFFVAGMVLLLVLYLPIHDNGTINRFRSSFEGSNDESYKVRELSRNFIQPYMHSHPFGGGLATTGALGMALNPGHFLAGFQTDSGYVQAALEIGWIGLAIICTLFFFVLRRGIAGYFNARDKEMRTLYAASTSAIFCFYVGMFAQNTLGNITDMSLYYPLIAIIIRFNYFETRAND